VRATFTTRARVTSWIRSYLGEKGFLEIETPTLHTTPGGKPSLRAGALPAFFAWPALVCGTVVAVQDLTPPFFPVFGGSSSVFRGFSGADAKPFATYHNALGLDLTLRIATELHLKRLVGKACSVARSLGRSF
jgi:lysyl-tRNA synthetase class 2